MAGGGEEAGLLIVPSPAGISDVGGEEEREEEGKGVEDEGGEAVDVMMERRETVDEGVARTLAFL